MTLLQTKNLHVDDKPEGVRLLWFDVAGRAVNVLTADVLYDLEKAIDRVAADEKARLLVLRSEKRSGFIAGADLHEFTRIRMPDEARAVSASGQRVAEENCIPRRHIGNGNSAFHLVCAAIFWNFDRIG